MTVTIDQDTQAPPLPGYAPDEWRPWMSNLHGSYLITLTVMSNVLNGLILFVICRNPQLRSPTFMPQNALVLNNFLFGVTDPFMSVPSAFARRWLFGRIGCNLYGVLGFIYGLFNIMLLALIALDRYFFICHPHAGLGIRSHRQGWIAVLSMFAYSAIWTTMPLVGWSSYDFEPFGTACTVNWNGKGIADLTYGIGCFFACYMVTLPVLIFCYTKIVLKVRQSQKNMRRHRIKMGRIDLEHSSAPQLLLPGADPQSAASRRPIQPEKSSSSLLKDKDFRMILTTASLTLSYFVCWTPYGVVCILAMTGIDFREYPLAGAASVGLAKLSLLLNPLLYSLLNTVLRTALFDLFGWHSLPPTQMQPRGALISQINNVTGHGEVFQTSRATYNAEQRRTMSEFNSPDRTSNT